MARKDDFLVSAIGVTGYSWLNKPDTKYNDDGVYHVTLNYDGDEPGYDEMVSAVNAKADELFEEWKRDPKNKKHLRKAKLVPVFKDEIDEDGEETGRQQFKAKTYATSKAGKKKTVKMRDSRDKPCKAQIFSGSRIRIMFTLGSNFIAKDGEFFVTAYLVSVQVIELAEGSGGGGGFGAVEGGYDGSQEEQDDDDNDTTDEGSSDDDGDDGADENTDF